ncbi:HD domain-containing protein [Clostridium diolis]|uniref:HD-CE domain-containing protein n=1 Tax=Clostridium diolis TaxID=223919 RepID=A0AAV3W2B0_9CLOT|nr:ATP-binding protein [Clostridium diolis]QES72156.1 ATP-binding protein [Clostridium diolis]GEA32435.1 hypothetical protein CDIOL_33580 [Clostridium diolis]
MEDYQKYMYKLETHLRTISDSNDEYTNLYATWELNKKTYRNVLKTVIMNYPHYSLHDDSHSETIITNIEMLLGEDRIRRLSPTDTWMLLHCSYLHDFGMALLYKKVEEEWSTDEFQSYLNDQKDSYDTDLIEAIEYIKNLKNNLQNEEFELIWPLKVRKYVTYIISDYFRAKHSNLTKEYLSMLNDWDIDISHNEFIQERIISLIGEISFLHTQNFNKVMELSYKTNGYKSDYIHPRFIAEMIRIGDLLDLDNGRFNSYIEKVNGELPKVSKNHKEKHKSTKHVLVTPNEIEVTIDCCNDEVYREARNWITWIEDEIKNLTMNWIDIVPCGLTGYAPKLTKKEVFLNGSVDFNNLADLRFNISQEKAFNIIEGSSIYGEDYIFIREFLQNALDATKIQLWRDLKNELYSNYGREENVNLNDLLPFDINEEIYKNYKLEIIIQDKNEKEVEIIIKDRGIGISLEALKSLCDVGNSYNGNYKLKKEINEMPLWLKPTGGFGIGLQSAFLVTKKFSAYTKTEGNSTIEMVFESRKSNGYIQVKNCDKDIKRGTEFHISLIIDNKEISYPMNGYQHNYIINEYDPIMYKSSNIYKMLDSIAKNYGGDLFPIDIKFKDSIMSTERASIIKVSRKEFIEKNDIMYKISEDLSNISIWHKESCSYVTIEMSNINKVNNGDIFIVFKGMVVNRIFAKYYDDFTSVQIDVYGLDTKKTLKLSRKDLTSEGNDQIKKIAEECKKIYLNLLKEKIDENKEGNAGNISKLGFIILGNRMIEKFNPKEYIMLENKDNSKKIWMLEKENGKFIMKEKNLKDFFEIYPDVSYIRIDNQSLYEKAYKKQYKQLENIISNNIEIDNNLILVDNEIIGLLNDLVVKEIKVLNNVDKILLFKVDGRIDRIGVKMDDETEEYFIKLLVHEGEEEIVFRNIGEMRQRSMIPAIERYFDLAVHIDGTLSRGLGNYNCHSYKIISPITLNDKKDINNYANKDAFVCSITARDDYKSLLKYTIENRVSKGRISEQEINKKYKELIERYFEIIKEAK